MLVPLQLEGRDTGSACVKMLQPFLHFSLRSWAYCYPPMLTTVAPSSTERLDFQSPPSPKERPEPASSYNSVRSGDYRSLQAPCWAKAGSTLHPRQEGRSKPGTPGGPALLRPPKPARRRPPPPPTRPAVPPSGCASWPRLAGLAELPCEHDENMKLNCHSELVRLNSEL
jgi:hypothetical protein